jgi:4-amino-4-deoxy-L-arabinose transferase-like glycosyltransferase
MELRKSVGGAGLIVAAAVVAALLAVHFLHPGADFPNFSPWMDYAKYTDEGWYGNAAVAHFVCGHWYVPGDFNPAVALPVLPILEWLLFHFTGVSLVAARLFAVTIFAGNLALTYALVRTQAQLWAAVLAVVLVASNAFLYCFSRLAILEPPLVFLILLAWVLALLLPRAAQPGVRSAMLVTIGFLLCGAVLTKTTAIFLFPSVFYLVWFARRAEARAALASCGLVALSAALPWLAYFGLAVRPHYLQDYRYLFTANLYTQPSTALGWLMAFWYSLHGTLWIDRVLVLVAFAVVLLSLVWLRELWRNPLFGAACIAAAGYLFFIGYHNNMQPRYYQVVAFPLAIMVAVGFHALLLRRGVWRTAAAAVAAIALGYTVMVNTRETIWFAFHPQYTFVDAARNLTRYVDEHPNRNRLLLSISGSNIALITGLPAICDDFGTLDLPARIRRYQPGWYAAWNELDPGTLEDLHTQFNLQQVASFPAYDDEDRNNLILYKLIPLQPTMPKVRPPRRSRRLPLGAEAGKPAEIRRVAD